MKKLILTGVLALGLGLVSFKSETKEDKKLLPDTANSWCKELSQKVYDDQLNSGASMDDA